MEVKMTLLGEQRATLLVVDDMIENIEILNNVLSDHYRVLFATNGSDALAVAREQLPDLILLDVLMPEMDGREVCARLKQNPDTREIPVIFVTAKDQEEDEEIGLQLGAVDYLTKPVRPGIVKLRVGIHLELKRYRDFLATLSLTDCLTGIPNRRRFDEFLKSEWWCAARTGSAPGSAQGDRPAVLPNPCGSASVRTARHGRAGGPGPRRRARARRGDARERALPRR